MIWSSKTVDIPEIKEIFYSIEKLQYKDKPDYEFIRGKLNEILIKSQSTASMAMQQTLPTRDITCAFPPPLPEASQAFPLFSQNMNGNSPSIVRYGNHHLQQSPKDNFDFCNTPFCCEVNKQGFDCQHAYCKGGPGG